jgi:hypothetical protein
MVCYLFTLSGPDTVYSGMNTLFRPYLQGVHLAFQLQLVWLEPPARPVELLAEPAYRDVHPDRAVRQNTQSGTRQTNGNHCPSHSTTVAHPSGLRHKGQGLFRRRP